MTTENQSRDSIAVIGGGVIGRSWTALFLANGYDVVISDPQDDIEETVRKEVPANLRSIPGKNFSDAEIEDLLSRIRFEADLDKAVEGVVAVQENGPETEDFKTDLFARLETLVGPDTLLLSSSSGITPDVSGAKMKNPNRLVVGHPFNPPHQLPLVEICGTGNADEAVIKRAMDFYADMGKAPARLNHPVPGFVANRLQTALVMEALRLVKDDVVDVATLDQIVLNSLGPRWASVGPLLAGHLGGGDGGLGGIVDHILNHLAVGMGMDPLPEEDVKKIGKMANETYPAEKHDEYTQLRDTRTIGILESR